MLFRPFTIFCTLSTIISGLLLYTQKHKTTLLDRQITQIVYETQKVKAHTAMLRTEWTLLNQPDRLETLAHNFLPDLHPLTPSQFIQMSSLIQSLPPIQKEEERVEKQDQTRQTISKAVAMDHGQPYTDEPKENKPALTEINTKPAIHVESTNEIPLVKTEKKNQPQQSGTNKTKTVPKSISHFKKENKRNSDISSPTNEENQPTQINKPETKEVKKETKLKQVKKIPKPNKHPSFSISDTPEEVPTVSKEKTDNSVKTHPKNTENSTIPKQKYQNDYPITHSNTKKKHHDSESAFGNDSDDSLPPPVPFSR